MTSYEFTHTLSWLGYADDIVTALMSIPGLQKCIDLLVSTFLRFFLKVNISKTETQVINQKYESPDRTYPDSIAHIDTLPLKNIHTFKYLGAKVAYNEAGTGWTEVNFRIESAKSQFAQKKSLFINFDISLKTRTLLLNSYVRSRLTYSCQNWAPTKLQLNK